MSKLLYLDLETTGLEEKDRICELGLIVEERDEVAVLRSLCKSSKKISIGAMALHHITNEMLADSPACEESLPYKRLEEENQEENVLIAHNIGFDLSMLEKEGLKTKMRTVDTLRCTKALIPECEKYALQYLRYELLLYKEEGALSEKLGINLSAHSALSDALHVKLLYRTLLQYATLSELIEISSSPVLMQKLPFGKYSGRYIEEIAGLDPAYLNWMLGSIENMDEDLVYSVKKYLEEQR